MWMACIKIDLTICWFKLNISISSDFVLEIVRVSNENMWVC